jgi:uncharacterized protein DUF4126
MSLTSILSLFGQSPPGDAAGLNELTYLLAALGLSTTAGLRAYLPLLAIGLASDIDPSLLPLQSNFKDLGNPVVLIILAVLVVGEFAIDKVPVLDHLSDVVHTVIRPVSGAIIMAGTHNSLSDVSPWVAAGVGAVLAFGLHGTKAVTRPAVTATTVGHGNPVVSLIEDFVVVLGVAVLMLLPVFGFILFAIFLVMLFRLLRRGWRWLRGRGKKGGGRAATSAATRAARGRGRRGRAAAPGAPVAPPAVVPPIAPPIAAAVPVGASPTPVYPPGMPTQTYSGPGPSIPVPVGAPVATGTGSGNTTTVAATNQAPFPPPAGIQSPPQGGGPQSPVTTTQPYPPVVYPSNAPTLPGTHNP